MAAGETAGGALYERIREAPLAPAGSGAWDDVQALAEEARRRPEIGELSRFLEREPVRDLLAGTLAGSPYLKGLLLRDPERLERLLAAPPERRMAELKDRLARELAGAPAMADAMRALRSFKAEVALLAALADLGGVWPVVAVTHVLTEAADAALEGAVRFLFRQAADKGEWRPSDASRPEAESGYIVLAMGKYGAHELNYSSDIDLIVFYDLERASLGAGVEAQPFFVRITRDLVRLMDERTGDGYVFRTDLRLRPDAGATQLALSTDAALIYYESFGQNWERAALIKARAAAGDIEAGELLLAEVAPFIWRKYLDFAAIADVHAMKRQIHAFRGFGTIAVAGHNIKVGRGGIREIEFFAQTQQLIAGGRQSDLRVRPTLGALETLALKGWIEEAVRRDLEAAYLFLRRIEHRLQMVADEQTHELPEDPHRLADFARFAGFADVQGFSAALVAHLENVQRHYARLFEDMPELTAAEGNMVFAGEEDDPATVAALHTMGYTQPSQVLATVRGWHHGRYPSVRSPRARERLTEVQPLLIAALAETGEADRAFASFDRFLAELPGGVQLFSLLRANPGLMTLVADIMGTAPRLARILSRRRRLLDAVLDPRTLGPLPDADDLDAVIAAELGQARDIQEILDRARVVGSEQAFLIGIRVLSGTINANQAGEAYALLAERLIDALQIEVEGELARVHGRIAGGAAAVVAMGKLGGREMTASSDLDLIVVYDFDPAVTQSDGARPLAPSHYYARLTQRLIAALSAPTSEGTLYEVDMRLRPSGQKGPVATQLSSFVDYQAKEAWTWEHLALTRARVVTGPEALRLRVADAIATTLERPREPAKIAADVLDMRGRIWAEKGTQNIWDLKQVRGGLVDLEFIAQHLQLIHAAAHPQILDQNTLGAYRKLRAAGLLGPAEAETLIRATRLLHALTQVLRLCLEGPFDPGAAPKSLKELLARAGGEASFPALEARLRQTLGEVAGLFSRVIG